MSGGENLVAFHRGVPTLVARVPIARLNAYCALSNSAMIVT